MISAELALAKTIVDIFSMEDYYDESPATDRLLRLMRSLTEEQGESFPKAYSHALETLVADLPRWREATDIAARFDLYEISGTVARQLLELPDPHQLATLAYLALNPAVPPDVVSQLKAARSLIPLAPGLSRMLEIRFSPDAVSESELELAVATQTWPGLHPRADLIRFAPTVYIAEKASSKSNIFLLSAALLECGARVRRIPENWNRSVPAGWISDVWPVVDWSGAASGWLRNTLPNFRSNPVIVSGDLSSSVAIERLINRIESRMPAGAHLRRTEQLSGVGTRAFAPETLQLGAFDAAEMAYLGAASRSVVQRVSKQALKPLDADVHRWRFDQLVALRVFQAFKATGRTFKGSPVLIQQQLAEISAANEQHRVAIDSFGEFYVEEGDEFRSLNGQTAIKDVLTMDEAFRPLAVGGGTYPDLLNPSRFTSVHPAVLCGTPVVSDHRVSARAVAEVYRSQGQHVARSSFPELSPFEIQDALQVGSGMSLAIQ